jgi:hypothetical protein
LAEQSECQAYKIAATSFFRITWRFLAPKQTSAKMGKISRAWRKSEQAEKSTTPANTTPSGDSRPQLQRCIGEAASAWANEDGADVTVSKRLVARILPLVNLHQAFWHAKCKESPYLPQRWILEPLE